MSLFCHTELIDSFKSYLFYLLIKRFVRKYISYHIEIENHIEQTLKIISVYLRKLVLLYKAIR